MTTGSAHRLPWSLIAPIPSAIPGRFSMSRRTLCRALAVVVALAAIIPLFADTAADGRQANPQHQVAQPFGQQPH
jgi:hypothetical protein